MIRHFVEILRSRAGGRPQLPNTRLVSRLTASRGWLLTFSSRVQFLSTLRTKAKRSRITIKDIINGYVNVLLLHLQHCASETIIANRSHRPARCRVNSARCALSWKNGVVTVINWSQPGETGPLATPHSMCSNQLPGAFSSESPFQI